MSKRSITISTPKKSTMKTKAIDHWVDDKGETKRLTIDVSILMHTDLKIACAKEARTMGDVLRSCINEYLLKDG